MSDGSAPKVAVKDRVTIHGLNKAPELNGMEGRIVSYEHESGRFLVRLTGDDRTLKVKPGNLESIPSGSGGGDTGGDPMANIDSNQMKKALLNATPEQLRRQAEMFKNMTKEQMKQLRRQQPHFKHMTDQQIRGMSAQMEQMSKNPEMMKTMKEQMSKNPEMMKQITEQMKNMSPDEAKYKQEMMKNLSPEQLKDIEKMQQKGMLDPNVDQAALGADMVKNMSPQQLSDMMKMQKEMLKKNPEMVKKMMASNPMMKNISPEQLEQQLDMMADMDPKNLERLMKVTQTVQKMSTPFVKVYGALNKATGGRANAIILVVCAFFFFYLVDYLFLSGGRVTQTVHTNPYTNSIDDFEDDEL